MWGIMKEAQLQDELNSKMGETLQSKVALEEVQRTCTTNHPRCSCRAAVKPWFGSKLTFLGLFSLMKPYSRLVLVSCFSNSTVHPSRTVSCSRSVAGMVAHLKDHATCRVQWLRPGATGLVGTCFRSSRSLTSAPTCNCLPCPATFRNAEPKYCHYVPKSAQSWAQFWNLFNCCCGSQSSHTSPCQYFKSQACMPFRTSPFTG